MTRELTITAPLETGAMEFVRDFDAPVAALFRAHIDPDLIRRWLGPRELTMTVHEWNCVSGGRYRYTHSGAGATFDFRGAFHTVRTDELIVQTFEFAGAPDSVSLELVRFVDLGGGRSRLQAGRCSPTRTRAVPCWSRAWNAG